MGENIQFVEIALNHSNHILQVMDQGQILIVIGNVMTILILVEAIVIGAVHDILLSVHDLHQKVMLVKLRVRLVLICMGIIQFVTLVRFDMLLLSIK